jgi:dienelactone hydrolase
LELLLCIALAPSAFGEGAPDVLPGTARLKLDRPLDEVMVAGISRSALRAIADAPREREARWQRDYSSAEAYNKSVEQNRARLRTIIGAVDERVAGGDFELVAAVGGDGVVAESADCRVLAVRWPVFEGVTAEGLLVEPRRPPVAHVVALPDADWTPEMFVGLSGGLGDHRPIAAHLAARGVEVIVPTLISRADTFSGNPRVSYTNQPHREFIYRQAFEMGRHIIGYEVQKVSAAIDRLIELNRRQQVDLPIGVVGAGEGGLVAFYAAAIDSRIAAAMVAGYFQPRERVWEEPIYRNVWALLTEFGDTEIASLIAPRGLVIEACAVPEIAGPPAAREGRRGGAAPGKIETCSFSEVQKEFGRAEEYYRRLGAKDRIALVTSGDGVGPSGSAAAVDAFLSSLVAESLPADRKNPSPSPSSERGGERTTRQPASALAGKLPDPDERQRRQIEGLTEFTQRLMRASAGARDEFWAKADRSSEAAWVQSAEFYRNHVWEEMIGKLPPPSMPPNVRTRRVIEDPAFTGYEVMIDVYPDVIAGGILLLPTDLRDGERRPAVVCQHGLEGVPMDTISTTGEGFRYYKAFSAELARRGFIVYAPQNPYRGEDRFRVIQRQSNPMKRSLFSYIIRQHERTVEWLRTLANVDPDRIGFYGLSYGGKTAVRVPPILSELYALSICSADFNEWVVKNASTDSSYSYVFTGEYEMPEWNLGHVANYAELAMLMTPRPFMVERGHDDGVAPDEWVAWEYAKVRRHYNKLGLGERTEIEYFNGPHSIHGEGTYRFLEKHLDWRRAKR